MLIAASPKRQRFFLRKAMLATILPQRSVITIRGEERIEFLQGLISNNAYLLKENKSIYSALLSPQGKFLHDFFLTPWQEKIFIDIASSRTNDLLARLKLYRLRSKAEFELDASLSVATLWEDKPENLPNLEKMEYSDFKIYNDPRMPSMGLRIIGNKNSIMDFCQNNNYSLSNDTAYNYFRLSKGIPDTGDMITDKSLLMEFGFEELHGVDFSKGCYIGQEVTARSKFRGQVRKSIYHVSAEFDLPEAGTAITLNDKIVGEIRTSCERIGLAIIYNEAYTDSTNNKSNFLCNGQNITVKPAGWITKYQ